MPKKVMIDYTSKDFESIKEDLIDHAKRYYPKTYNDFNESSFGSMLFDSVAYVGDMLSYYLDFNVNESYMDTAVRYNNVRKMAEQKGYKFWGKPATFGVVDIYILIPALQSDLGPVPELFPVIKKGTILQNSSGILFTLVEDVDFNHPTVQIVASKYSTSGNATEYALRHSGQVKSGMQFSSEIDVGDPVKFRRVRVGPNGINEILSVTDSEGHSYYQVDNLSQDVIYMNTTNPNAADDGVRDILKPMVASRRYVVEQDETGTYLQFGYGSEDEFDSYGLVDPSNVMLEMSGKSFVNDNAFDPNRLTSTDKFGISPSNTTLRVSYGANNSLNVNTARNSLNGIVSVESDFPYDEEDSYRSGRAAVIASMEVANPNPIVYNSNIPSIEEIKFRAHAVYASQNRVVTKGDYEAYCYQMPPNLGQISRVSVYNDPSGTNKRMCLYVISETSSGNFIKTHDATKNNLRTWLNKNRMISDLIDIKDAKIINVGFNYQVVSRTRDTSALLASIQNRLASFFSQKKYIAEPIHITDIYTLINRTPGVVDTVKVTPVIKNTSAYSQMSIDIEDILSKDGTYLKTPSNCVLEIKYPELDFKGTVV